MIIAVMFESNINYKAVAKASCQLHEIKHLFLHSKKDCFNYVKLFLLKIVKDTLSVSTKIQS